MDRSSNNIGMNNTKIINSIEELTNEYDAFIIDQWGVLHDGFNSYIGSIEFLRRLKEQNKKIIILTNSGKPAKINQDTLDKLGFSPNLYDNIISSGEAFRLELLNNQFPFIKEKCYIISVGNDQYLWEEYGIIFDKNIDNCNWIMLASFNKNINIKKLIEKISIKKRSKLLPLICLNPDKTIISSNGETYAGPGELAFQYQIKGGEVIYYGKPYQPIYKKCLEILGENQKILCVGDSILHDIKGATNMGLDSLLIGQGIYNHDFKINKNQLEVVEKLSKRYKVSPTWYSYNFSALFSSN